MLKTLKEASCTVKDQGVYLPGASGVFTAHVLVCKWLLGCFAPLYWGVLDFWVTWAAQSVVTRRSRVCVAVVRGMPSSLWQGDGSS